ncbi:hypothetical protein AAC03nite_34330 [Alicyclobacillus acidoterrestris]|nr:hypothetical protein AAC03nite_34330 [Alicyclobacillus acidoterrestris]
MPAPQQQVNQTEQILAMVLEIRSEFGESGNSNAALTQLETIVDSLNARLKASDANIIASNIITNLNTILNNIINVLGQTRNGGINYLANLNPHIEPLKNFLYQIPIIEVPEEAAAYRESLVNFRRSLSQHAHQISVAKTTIDETLNKARSESEDIEKTAQNLKSRIQEMEDAFENQQESFITQFNTMQSELVEKFQDESDTRQSHFTKYLSGLQSDFQASLELYKENFELAIKEAKDKTSHVVSELEEIVRNTINTQEQLVRESTEHLMEEAKNVVASLNNIQKEVAELAGTVTGTVHAGAYKEIADTEDSRARTWRFIAFGCFLLLVIAAGAEFFLEFIRQKNTPFNWAELSGRLVVTAAIAALAGYAAKQSSSHFKNAQYNRRMQLIMSSIDPYLQSLEPDARQKIKESLAEPLFKTPDFTLANDGKEEASFTTDQIMKLMSDLTSSFGKKD